MWGFVLFKNLFLKSPVKAESTWCFADRHICGGIHRTFGFLLAMHMVMKT